VPKFSLLDFHCKVTKVHSSQHLYYTSIHKISGVRTYHLLVRTPESHNGAIANLRQHCKNETARQTAVACRAVLQHWLSAASMRPVNNQLRHSKPPFTVSTDF
jgi:hypothetical protein